MAGDLGQLSLFLAIAITICIMIPFRFFVSINKELLIIQILWSLCFFCSLLALGSLIYCYIISDFTILNVVNNSHTDKPMIYKITGAWSNHEGSMLLMLLAISCFSFLFAIFPARNNIRLVINTLIIQAIIVFGTILFIICKSNPFEKIFPSPINGLGLNPILQDIGIAFHPPVLYLGYVGFSIAFSASIAAMLSDQIGKQWAQIIRPWVLLAWSFLTLGITSGSWWAYRELGWGGYWFWDPVENASLMPWLSGTALLHSIIVATRTNNFKSWTVLLAISTFSLSLTGTFLIRSGLITSVHSFANDPDRGIWILIYLGILTGTALIIYAFKASKIPTGNAFPIISKEFFILSNNIIFVIATLVIVIATFYPLVFEMIYNKQVAIGPLYFNTIFAPMVIVLLLLCTIWNECKAG